MRIVQLIDSLDAGGAERMAVNYANALESKIEFSGLVTTRKEGGLKEQINPKVSYLFLKKQKTLDLKATQKLYQYCKKNKIDYLHAHSSSYFLAVIIKLVLPKIKIIWHVHNGLIQKESKKNLFLVKLFSIFFNSIITVNKNINNWIINKINFKNTFYLENFSTNSNILKETFLFGNENKRILLLANLRFPKNHLLLVEVAKNITQKHPDWSFHLVGKDFEDEYSKTIKERIETENLQKNIYIYGSKNDTDNIIEQAEICILTSESEGLPVALIEYGMHKKPVVCTAVGEIPNIINTSNGFLTSVNNALEFSNHLFHLIENPTLRKQIGENFYTKIYNEFSEEKIINKYLSSLN